jgi:hypothetical protein
MKQKAAEEMAAAEQAAAMLSTLKAASAKHEARVEEVQQELKDAGTKCEALEQKGKEQDAELAALKSELQKERVDRRSFEEEVRQVKAVIDGKPYSLRCTFGGSKFALLTQVWRSLGVRADLQKSVADANKLYASRAEDDEARLFWAQFESPEHSPLLVDHMKQLMEMHRMAEPAMKDLCIRLWPDEPLPSSYFGLVQKLRDAAPRVDVLKRSTCIEGARMAFARTMVHWPKIKPAEMATGLPPLGKEHRCPEQYFPVVIDGARAIEAQCAKDGIYE